MRCASISSNRGVMIHHMFDAIYKEEQMAHVQQMGNKSKVSMFPVSKNLCRFYGNVRRIYVNVRTLTDFARLIESSVKRRRRAAGKPEALRYL
jgi:hypothetical protein